MDADSCNQLPNPKRLKVLASNVEYTEGNLLHKFVLDNSYPNQSRSESDIHAHLLTISSTTLNVNALDRNGYSPLHLAVLRNNFLMVKQLLSCLVNIDVNITCDNEGSKNAALHLAAELGHLNIIEELVIKGADVNLINGNGDTALCLCFSAQLANILDVIKVLVDKGANVNLRSRMGFPLEQAVQLGDLEIVKFLLNQGADLHAMDKYGLTLLHKAVYEENLEIIKFLIDQGANLYAVDKNGKTLLHYAMCSGNFEIVKFFLDQNTDLHSVDKDGKTVLHDAFYYTDNVEIINFLLDQRAETEVLDKAADSFKIAALLLGILMTLLLVILLAIEYSE